MQLISLFSGIGGFELAGEWAGYKNILSCEINEFGNSILEYYWPSSYHHRDIRTLDYETIIKKTDWNPSDTTVVVGGFP